MTSLFLRSRGDLPSLDSARKTFAYAVIITDGAQKNGPAFYPSNIPRMIVDVGGRWTTDVVKKGEVAAGEVVIVDNINSLRQLRRTVRFQFCSQFE